ncbi:MAG: endonuclease III [Candidatus Micrarchaeota archaeon]|nr:endonuclease III [Candidatus Micrarchaeota archaeon]
MQGKDTERYMQAILKKLTKRYGASLKTQLEHQDMTQLFVAVLLSPQSTDKQTNAVTEKLFRRYRTFEDFANADIKRLSKDLSGMNYYKTKARHLKESSRMILERFHGKVPSTLHELMELKGVGRKVANVVQAEGFGIHEGIAVDTHCGRVARRLLRIRSKDPAVAERRLMRITPQKDWRKVSNLFIELGRDACKARNRECYRCVLKEMCPSSLAK